MQWGEEYREACRDLASGAGAIVALAAITPDSDIADIRDCLKDVQKHIRKTDRLLASRQELAGRQALSTGGK